VPRLRLGGRPRLPENTVKAKNNNRAYRYGWNDGRYGLQCCFTENGRLAEFEAPAERLDYYRGHRVGWEDRRHSGDLLRAS
jgi:hypothetical protein